MSTEAGGRSLKSFLISRPWLKPIFRVINNARCKTWDVLHGANTCGQIPLISLNFQSDNKSPGLEYHSHHPRIIRQSLMALNIRHEDYTFIDFGCGKGRVLLLASEFPFRRIVGLEFSPQLAEIAKRNLKSYRSKTQRCRDIEVLIADATEYQLPPEPEVLYFYSPFTGQTMERVVKNIESSVQKSPRELLVLFTGLLGMRDRAFGCRPQYERLRREYNFDIYRQCSR
jgi:SAM-dependent methyltransferase